MATKYAQHFAQRPSAPVATPQTQPVAGKATVKNNAGGYGFQITPWQQLDRFLILGSEGGTYYVGEQSLTIENAKNVLACLLADGKRAVARIVEVSVGGKAPKNDAAIFALALAASGDEATRQAAYAALPQVARTGTHLFQFLAAVNEQRGWGRGLRSAVANWYASKSADNAAYQMVKYQQREGWSHRDALRLAHVKPESAAHSALYAWAVGKEYNDDSVPAIIKVYETMKMATDEATVLRLIRDHNLTWEFVPGQWLGSKAVWETLLPNLPLGALLRNLARLTALGVIGSMKAETMHVVAKLTDAAAIRKARLHPIAILNASRLYAQGHGDKGSLTWAPVAQISAALDDAFYKAFDNVEATNQRIMLALDVSGSMNSSYIAGTALTARDASIALALVHAKTEDRFELVAFTDGLTRMPMINKRSSLNDALRHLGNLPFGGTDCAQPMIYAMQHKTPVDAFVVYTDSETWAGRIHPYQALQQYRSAMGINAKLIVVGMTASKFTIADPGDAGMLDVAGFSTDTPALINGFISGW